MFPHANVSFGPIAEYISECLALKWADVDWPNRRLLVERGIVCQEVDDLKTPESRKKLVIDRELLAALQAWKQSGQFSAPEDWMFASPVAWALSLVL
jgi:integrase